MTDWPSTLPQYLSKNDFADALPDNVIASTVDVGPAILRRRTTSNSAVLSGSMLMTAGQWDDLATFFTTTVKETLPFNFPDPDGSGTISVRFKQGAPPSRKKHTPLRFRVNLTFEKLPG
jgi:hypothetical protein